MSSTNVTRVIGDFPWKESTLRKLHSLSENAEATPPAIQETTLAKNAARMATRRHCVSEFVTDSYKAGSRRMKYPALILVYPKQFA
jgi:hypothetical protein